VKGPCGPDSHGKSEAGAALSALRRRAQIVCAVCGTSFTALRTARYCSNRCRQAAKYARSKQFNVKQPENELPS
jgi:predicted nucleic acid-binding Zn ribbon protein